jgi:arginine N-succinyltransferase
MAFIARHRERFGARTLAELRGRIAADGSSDFWDGLAGRFFGMTFQEADHFNGTNGNQFIADLMPKHPVYVAMLPEAARSVIGMPHPNGRAAMRMLEEEGFAAEGYVDIFDGGPTMTARTDRVRSIAEAREAAVSQVSAPKGSGEGAGASPANRALVATGKLGDFRCCLRQWCSLSAT